ncbi:MAG: hypothetical protein ACJAYB_003388 [Psychromonas sp.]|jgi:hypothetical protein
MNKLQSHEIQSLDLDMQINETIAVRMDGFYELVVCTNDADGEYASVLVTQKNKVRQFKTLNAVDSFLLSIDIDNFVVMSEYDFNEKGF